MIYDENKILTMYQRLIESSKERLGLNAIDYFGNKISYEKLIKNIDDVAYGLVSKLNIKKGDRIAFCCVNSPEFIYLLYALNKIGAIPCMIYPTAPIDEIKYSLKLLEPKFIAVTENRMICDKINQANSDLNLDVLPLSPSRSLPKNVKTIYNVHEALERRVKGKYTKDDYLDIEKLFNNGNVVNDLKAVDLEFGAPAIMHPTGGTTGGKPKFTMIGNENAEGLLRNFELENIVFSPGQKNLDVLVPFVAYGSANLHKGLVEGTEIVIVPVFDQKKLPSYFKKNDINIFSGVPSYYIPLLESKKLKNKDLSCATMYAAGGDSMTLEENERINSLLRQHNSHTKLLFGLGMTENYTTLATNTYDSYLEGTVGVPIGKNTIKIVKPGTEEEVKDGEQGEIIINGPSVALGYYKNEKQTEETFKKHSDGKIWLHTGDCGEKELGITDKNGRSFIFFKGRYKDMIPRSGYKIFTCDIENEISTNPAIEKCSVVSVPDKIDNHAPKAHVSLKEEYKGREDEIFKQIIASYDESKMDSFQAYHCPVAIKFRDYFPLTKVRKINKQALQIEDIVSSYDAVLDCNISLLESGEYKLDIKLKDGYDASIKEKLQKYVTSVMKVEGIPDKKFVYDFDDNKDYCKTFVK